MKIYLYEGGKNVVGKSGVGKALEHQRKAFERNHIPYTTNRKEEYDIIQLNTIFPDSVFMAKKAKRKGKKVIYYGHSTMEDFKRSFRGSNLFAPLFKKWISFCYRSGDVIITPSEYSKKLLDTYHLDRPVVALSNGIDLNFYDKSKGNRKKFRKKYGISEDERVIMSVGHYMERKGIYDFIEMARKMPQYRFIWFGYTNLALVPTKIKRALESKPQNLILPGYVEKEELRDALCGSDVFAFLSFEETEGIALMEAFAMKIPVIIRDIVIYQDFEDGKMVLKGKDKSEFESRIRQITENSREAEKLVKNAYEYIKKKDVAIIGQNLEKIYEGMMESNCSYDVNVKKGGIRNEDFNYH